MAQRKLRPIEQVAQEHADDLVARGALAVLILYRTTSGANNYQTLTAKWGDPAVWCHMANEYADGVLDPPEPECETEEADEDEAD